jgi:hypothetical protein
MVFLDNGVWETGHPLPQFELESIAHSIGATHVVSPDLLDDYSGTVELAEDFMNECSGKYEPVAVVQGMDNEERIECYVALVLLGYRHLCFPITPNLPQVQREEERLKLLRTLKQRQLIMKNARHHLMTLDVVSSLWQYASYKVEFVDTRLPLHLANNGEVLSEASVRPIHRVEIDLSKPLLEDRRALALENVARLRIICGGRS